jgi:hypothetical protein
MNEVKEKLRAALEPILEEQGEHPVYGRLRVLWDEVTELARLPVQIGVGAVRAMGLERILEFVDERARIIADEMADPYRHGYEPPIWREADWRLAELRLANPGDPIIFAVLGGNGSGKSYYGARCFDLAMVENEDWLCWQHSLDEDSSREIPQRIIYSYLPEEFRTEKGKLKKTAQTKLTYNKVNGFTDNAFGLPNSSRALFKFYGGGDVNALEGPRPDFAWPDEMVPLDWVEGSCRRLVTKAGLTRKLIPALEKAVEVRRGIIRKFTVAEGGAAALTVVDGGCPEPAQAGTLMPGMRARMQAELEEAWRVHLRPLLPRLMQGVCLVTFTPKNGYTQTVAALTGGARVVEEVEAELLPILKNGEVIGYEKVPRVMINETGEFPTVVMFFHIYDNAFGGNWESQRKRLGKLSREEKLWQAYGVATKMAGVALPRFNATAHVRPLAALPKTGTWYHVVDPCTDGRNWFMLWAKVCPNPIGPPLIWVAREWPQEGDWIVAGNVGNPGPWATLRSTSKADGRKKSTASKADGERGPAQRLWGLGFQEYASEIERVERELFALENPGKEGRIELLDRCRIMDSRSGNTENQSHSATETLLETMKIYELDFVSAGRDSGAESGSTKIKEGVGMINDRLFYDEEQAELLPEGGYRFHGRAPSVYVAETCRNLIFAMGTWTGQDGGEGATKDPIDALRYLVISKPEHWEAEDWMPRGGLDR